MALEQKLRLRLAQRLVMTPSLQQAIKLLQLSRLELEEALTEEILENPLLEVEQATEDEGTVEDPGSAATGPDSDSAAPPTAGEPSGGEADPADDRYREIDVEAFFADYLGDGLSEGRSLTAREDGESSIENTLTAAPGLYEHLVWQLHLASCPLHLLEACEFVIGNLNDEGLLVATDDEIRRATGVGEEDLAAALAIVRSLDPPGIAARTLQECLLAQVDRLERGPGEEELLARVRRLLSEGWDDLLHQRWEKVSRLLECEVAEIRPLLDVIHRLEPQPGRVYNQDRNIYVQPDVYVRKVDGEYLVILNDDGLPRLRVNSRYARMLERDRLDPQVASYLREKLRSAVWLMKSIDQRQRTIFKVATSIVVFQRSFFDHGIEHLRPMVLRQVADDIGMHESTISRVVSNKYMYTPRGLFPMKYFFHSGVDSAHGENVSSLVVKARIRKLIEAEDQARPLSDSKLMKILQREGMRLARRTVAKYREEMGLSSSDKRRRVF